MPQNEYCPKACQGIPKSSLCSDSGNKAKKNHPSVEEWLTTGFLPSMSNGEC
jgi:hypothetical protein